MDYGIKYQELLKELEVLEKIYIHKNLKTGYFILYGEINRRDVLLKVFPISEVRKVGNTYKEAMADAIIERHNKNLKKSLILKTRVLEVGQNETFVWIIRRYYHGLSLTAPEESKNLFGPDKFSVIQTKFLGRKDRILPQVVSNLEALKSLEPDFHLLGVEESFFEKRFKTEFSSYEVAKLEDLLSCDLTAQTNFFNHYQADYFSNRNIVATLGDLIPAT